MRSEAEWTKWFKRRDAKRKRKSGKHAGVKKKARTRRSGIRNSGIWVPRVVGEPLPFAESPKRSYIEENADKNRNNPTPAEEKLEKFLNEHKGGRLRGKFEREYVISGKWIVDFFFPENRLAIEVDGSIHQTAKQKELDRQKDEDCARFDITMLRINNREIDGDRGKLIEKLRSAWLEAKNRKNQIIGIVVDE